jgi:hypothetical protein
MGEQVLSPSMENAEDANLRAQVLGARLVSRKGNVYKSFADLRESFPRELQAATRSSTARSCMWLRTAGAIFYR